MLVYGRLYVSVGATLAGTGNVAITPSGQFILRNVGTLNVATLNEGLAGTGIIDAATFMNNGVFQHVEFTLNLDNGATFINKDSVAMLSATDSYFGAASGSGAFVNNPGSVLHKASGTGVGYLTQQ